MIEEEKSFSFMCKVCVMSEKEKILHFFAIIEQFALKSRPIKPKIKTTKRENNEKMESKNR